MNARKTIHLLEFITFLICLSVLIFYPEQFNHISIILFGLLSVLILTYFTFEYFYYIKPKKVFLLKRKNQPSIVSIFGWSSLVILVLFLYLQYNIISEDSLEIDLFFIIIGAWQMLYRSSKGAIKLDREKFNFPAFIEKDIAISNINKAILDIENKKLVIKVLYSPDIVIDLEEEFFLKEKQRLRKIAEFINKKS